MPQARATDTVAGNISRAFVCGLPRIGYPRAVIRDWSPSPSGTSSGSQPWRSDPKERCVKREVPEKGRPEDGKLWGRRISHRSVEAALREGLSATLTQPSPLKGEGTDTG